MTFENLGESTSPSTPTPEAELADSLGELDPTFVSGSSKPSNRNVYVLGALGVVGAGVIWFSFFRGSPAAADAAASNQTSNQVREFLDSGNINLMKTTLKSTEKIVQQFRSYPAKTQVPLSALQGNPFRELPPKTQEAAATNPRDEELAQLEHAEVVKAVAELKLQSIIRGRRTACMINNTLYQEGQQVGRFVVAQITPTTVVVESGKYRFELKVLE